MGNSEPKKGLKNLFKIKWDSSLYFLIATNIIIIILAVIKKFDFPTILFVYWCQSVIIGFFNFIRILSLKNFTEEKVPTKAARGYAIFSAFFFLIHFWGFHLVYLIFLLSIAKPNFTFISTIILSAGLLFINHLFSFIKNFKHDTEKKQDIGKVMSFPYARILPMHLTIMFGLFLVGNKGIIFFLILKTIADVIMHNREHQD